MHTRAFTLRDSYDAELFGGSITTHDGKTFDVGAALRDGDGQIVTSDEKLIGALDVYPALKSVAVEQDAETTDESPSYDTLLKADLQSLADDRGVEYASDATKDQIIAALVAADEEGNG